VVQSCFPSLAASPLSAASRGALAPTWTTSPRKTRARSFCRTPSGRLSRRARVRPMFTPGSRGCGYSTASGRAKWPNRDPIGELGFQTLTNGKRGKRLREELNLYDFVRNDGLNHFDVLGLEEGETWDQTYERLRDRENYGPLKACEEANKIHGTSKSCSALGRDPKPKLYCGCSYSKILDAANWLRHNADGRPAGADKLAHCYAFCVGSFWYGNITRFYTDDSDPEDVEANKKGISIGLGWTFNPCSCLDKCAKATRDMNFN